MTNNNNFLFICEFISYSNDLSLNCFYFDHFTNLEEEIKCDE